MSVAADLSPHTVVLLTARSPQAYGIPQSEIIPYGAYFGNHQKSSLEDKLSTVNGFYLLMLGMGLAFQYIYRGILKC